jgi:energy-converting hydrogenase Eha subunit A
MAIVWTNSTIHPTNIYVYGIYILLMKNIFKTIIIASQTATVITPGIGKILSGTGFGT